jgi:hypothetical protein
MPVTAEDLEHLPYLDRNLGRVFTKDCKENIKQFIRDFRATDVGRQIKDAGLDTGENLDAILEDAQTQTGHEDVTMREFEASARRMWLIGDLKPKQKPVEQPPAPKPLTASQQAWSEYRIFSEAHTSSECKARARVDAGYASFMRKNYEREFAASSVGDAVVNLNEKTPTTKKAVPADVAAYAARYRTMSADAARKELSPGMNPSGPAAAAEANRLFEACCEAGLI